MTLDTGEWARQFGSRQALVNADSGMSWSFDQLHQTVLGWAARLTRLGVQRGDRILWLARNRLDFFAALLACYRQGWVLVPLNWRESIEVLHQQSHLIEPRLVLHEVEFESVATSLQRQAGVRGMNIDVPPEAALPDAPGAIVTKSEEPWYLLFTSGTTGTPKAVIYTPAMAAANAGNVDAALALTPDDVTASVLPQHHTAGINLFALPLLMKGGSVRVYHRFEPQAFIAELISQRVSVLLLVPTQYRLLIDTQDFRKASSLSSCARVMSSGGGPIDTGLLANWAEKGVAIRNGCGMTESGPTLFFQTEAEALEVPGCVGQPMPLSEVRLVGPHGEAVAEGQAGEVWVRGPAVTPGYWFNARANRMAFSDRWYRSGDLAVIDRASGQYRIVDRVTDMYICGGENVYPADVEQMLLQHRSVSDVAVGGEHDQTWGETGVAFVVLKPGYQATPEELQHFARQRLASYKVPHRWVFLDELPHTPTGKIRRSQIKSWLRGPG
jgi:fatty-acyl-CoA synthase